LIESERLEDDVFRKPRCFIISGETGIGESFECSEKSRSTSRRLCRSCCCRISSRVGCRWCCLRALLPLEPSLLLVALSGVTSANRTDDDRRLVVFKEPHSISCCVAEEAEAERLWLGLIEDRSEDDCSGVATDEVVAVDGCECAVAFRLALAV